MKLSTTAWLAIGAGVALAAAAGFLLGTEKGRNVTRTWRDKGRVLADDAREKLTGLQQQFKNGWRKEETASAAEPEIVL